MIIPKFYLSKSNELIAQEGTLRTAVLSDIAYQVLQKPSNWFRTPQPYLTEYLRLGPSNGIGRAGKNLEAGPRGRLSALFRSDERSQFYDEFLTRPYYEWNVAEVTRDGHREVLLWSRDPHGVNGRVTELLNRPDTLIARGGGLAPGEEAVGPGYIIRNFIHKSFVDIMTTVQDARTFESAARRTFAGWWRAIPIAGGWRVFGDDEQELAEAERTLSR